MPLLPAEQMPVNIHVKTEVHHDGHKETFEMSTSGRYCQKGGSSFLQYEELTEEGKINTTVKISDQEVLILRSGAVKMRMKFQQHKTVPGTYESPYGMMQTAAFTKRLCLSCNIEKNSGLLELLYDLAVQGSSAGSYHLKIRYEEEVK